MTTTIDDEGRRESPPPAETARQSATRRRIADLEAMIARQRNASLRLSAQGLPTQELERIIDILVCSLQLVRDCQAATDNDSGPRDEIPVSVKAIF
jgi:hypothetical protein